MRATEPEDGGRDTVVYGNPVHASLEARAYVEPSVPLRPYALEIAEYGECTVGLEAGRSRSSFVLRSALHGVHQTPRTLWSYHPAGDQLPQ